ncbi:DUF1508 domain-containing protein [Salinibacter sp. 10B]|uniref:YegP family protein n=1 Tax=Salinibacter sp. 10B TaxID=1923971 RepID=UPI0015E44DF8|nr:DUF1508 domain-containing protein [Salinibacter sp. 10B]
MSDSSTRLGALAEKWDVPGPDKLKTLLEPEPSVTDDFYESSLPISSGDGPAGNRSTFEDSSREERKAHFEIYRIESGDFRWRFVDESGHILANSGGAYPTSDSCLDAIERVRHLGPEAEVEEKQ